MVKVKALTNVAYDDATHAPGDVFDVPEEIAHALGAIGAVEPAPVQTSAGPAPAETPLRGDRSADENAEEVAQAIEPALPDYLGGGDDLTRVHGIGATTAARLRDAGVRTLAALGALSDDRLDALGVRPSWRDEAAVLAAPDDS